VPGFPVWDLAGLLGSTSWGLWVAALGVTLLLRSVQSPSSSAAGGVNGANGGNGVNALDIPLGNTPNPTRPAEAGLRS
jgi:hypothetical protein